DENFQMDKTTNTMIQHVGFSHQLKLPFAPFITFISRLPNLISLRANVAEFTRAVPPPQITTKIRHMSIFLQQKTTLDEIEFLVQISPIKRLYLEIGSEGYWYGPESKLCDFVRLAKILNNCQTLVEVEVVGWYFNGHVNIPEVCQLSQWFTQLHIGTGYQDRKSLQTPTTSRQR
ncbi:unnamed protein product, partial [Adineta ricciae]